MNETPEISYSFHCYNEYRNETENALMKQARSSTEQPGMEGESLPYQLRSDWMVNDVLLLCFILVSYVLSHGKRHLMEEFKNFFSSKERGSLFDDTTASDMRHTLVLIFQTCLLSGFCLFDYFFDHANAVFDGVPHQVVLVSSIAVFTVYFLLKWLVYSCVNLILFNKAKTLIWNNAYFNVIIWIGFLLFPLVLLIVFFDLSSQLSFIFAGIIVIISKFLLAYKCFKNFFNQLHHVLHFILYFCALEILPDLILWKGVVFVDSYWF